MQASQNDFYFSHRIFFFFKSVLFEKITDVQKQESQREASDVVLKSIYKTILTSVQRSIKS